MGKFLFKNEKSKSQLEIKFFFSGCDAVLWRTPKMYSTVPEGLNEDFQPMNQKFNARTQEHILLRLYNVTDYSGYLNDYQGLYDAQRNLMMS